MSIAAGRAPVTPCASIADTMVVSDARHVKDNRLLDGRAVRDRILDQVADRVRQVTETHVIGRLVSVSIGEQNAAAVYVRAQASAARKVGLRFEDQTWPSGLSQEECKARLVAMNNASASSCLTRPRSVEVAELPRVRSRSCRLPRPPAASTRRPRLR